MGIKVYTPDLSKVVESTVKEVEDALVYNFSYVGERCVAEARTGHGYTDRTGNLTSSMGYVVVKDGRVVHESAFNKTLDGKEGSASGRQFARSLASQQPEGIALIVVAGMNYARYVADKGFNVLDSAEIMAGRLVPSIMEKLGFRRIV